MYRIVLMLVPLIFAISASANVDVGANPNVSSKKDTSKHSGCLFNGSSYPFGTVVKVTNTERYLRCMQVTDTTGTFVPEWRNEDENSAEAELDALLGDNKAN